MGFECFRNEAEQIQQNLSQSWVESIFRVLVIPEEGHNHPQLFHLTNRRAGWINRRLLADDADRPLKFLRINRGNPAVVIKVLKRLVSAVILLEIGKYQFLSFSKSFGLVDCDLRWGYGN